MQRGSQLIILGFIILGSFLIAQVFGPFWLGLLSLLFTVAGFVTLASGSEATPRPTNCVSCGAPNPQDADQCEYCGSPLDA